MTPDGLIAPAALEDSLRWLAAMLTGSLATLTCGIATAALGFLMLAGTIPVRRGVMVVFGCFLVFSASWFAMTATSGITNSRLYRAPTISLSSPPAPAEPLQAYDPYAGAAMPQLPQ